MNLRINVVKAGVVASLVALSSCVDGRIAENAKQNVIPYLTAKELLEAENTASKIEGGTDACYVHQVMYWDSILAEHQIKDAYYDGKKYAVDFYNGLNPEKAEFTPSLSEAQFPIASEPEPLKKFLSNKVAEYVSAKEFVNLREQEPGVFRDFGRFDFFNDVKFWNDIKNTFRQKEAFDKGVKEVNDSLSTRKLSNLEGLTISK